MCISPTITSKYIHVHVCVYESLCVSCNERATFVRPTLYIYALSYILSYTDPHVRRVNYCSDITLSDSVIMRHEYCLFWIS